MSHPSQKRVGVSDGGLGTCWLMEEDVCHMDLYRTWTEVHSPSNEAFLTETELAKCDLSFTTFTSSMGTLAILAYA